MSSLCHVRIMLCKQSSLYRPDMSVCKVYDGGERGAIGQEWEEMLHFTSYTDLDLCYYNVT